MLLESIDFKPKWALDHFESEISEWDKISEVANPLIFGTCLLTPCLPMPSNWFYLISGFAVSHTFRKVVQTAFGFCAYPMAVKYFWGFNDAELQEEKEQIDFLINEGFFVKKMFLWHSGTRYETILVANHLMIDSGVWTIEALGNCAVMNFCIKERALKNFNNKTHTLFLNGPSVGASGGFPTRHQLGAGFEAAMQFLEKEVKATRILLNGVTTGMGFLSEAILKHDFTKGLTNGTKYLVISYLAAGYLSEVAGDIGCCLAAPCFSLAGMELDSVLAAKKLSELEITQIVIQHSSLDGKGSDSLLKDSISLSQKINKELIIKYKIFLTSPNIKRDEALYVDIEAYLNKEIAGFIGAD